MSSTNLVVKMMSGEDLPDNDVSKGFTLVEAFGEVRCVRDANNKPIIEIPTDDGPTTIYHPEGNTYVIKNGKTVATFSFTSTTATMKSLKQLASANYAKQQVYSGKDYIWCTDMNQLPTPKRVTDKFVIIDDLEYLKSIKGSVDVLDMLGWNEVDYFECLDAKQSFRVFEKTEGFSLPILYPHTYANLTSIQVENLARLSVWEKPRLVIAPITIKPDGYKQVKKVTLNLEVIDVWEFDPTTWYDYDNPSNVNPRWVVAGSRPNESLYVIREVDDIDKIKLGKDVPFITINLPIGEYTIAKSIEEKLKNSGYNKSHSGGLYYWVGTSDAVVEDRIIEVGDILNQFKDGYPHSLFFRAKDILIEGSTDIKYSILALRHVLGYEFTRQTSFLKDGMNTVEMQMPHIEPISEDIALNKGSNNLAIKNQEDMQLLKALPNNLKPKVISKIRSRAMTAEDALFFMAHYKEVENGYEFIEM